MTSIKKLNYNGLYCTGWIHVIMIISNTQIGGSVLLEVDYRVPCTAKCGLRMESF